VVPNHNPTTNSPGDLNVRDFWCKKQGFWPQNQNFPAKKPTVEFQTVSTERLLDSRSKRYAHKGGRERGVQEEGKMNLNLSAETCYTIEGWDPKHLWKCMGMQAARKAHFECSESLTDTPEVKIAFIIADKEII